MVNLGELFFSIVAKDDSSKALTAVSGNIDKTQSKILGMTKIIAGLQIGSIVAGAVGTASNAIGGFFQDTINASSDASEEMEKFGQVFKDQATAGESWVGATAAEMGRSEGMVRSMAATFGAVLTPQMDGNRKKALELSEGYTKLAVDLSSFMNVSEDEAAKAISSAIAGETEPMRRFGVMLNEAAVNAELMAMGLNKTQKEASAAELQQARYNIIMKATADAQGDAVRTADGYANATRALGARFDELKVQVGNAIMPIATSLITVAGGAVNKFIDIWRGLAPKITPIIDGIGKGIKEFAEGLGKAAMPAIQKIVDMLPGALTAITGLFSKVGATAGPILAQIFAGLPAVIDGAIKTFNGLASAIGPIAMQIGTAFRDAFAAVSNWWNANGSAVFRAIGDGLMGIVKFVEPIAAAIMSVLVPALQSIGKFWQESMGKIGEWWARDGQVIQQGFKVLSDTVGGALSTAIRVLGGLFNDYLLPPLEWLAGGILDVVLDGVSELGKWLASAPVQDGIAGIAKGFEDLCTWLEPAGQWLKDAGEALGDFIGDFLGTDPLHGFIDALGLVYEAIDLVQTALRGDIAGAATKWETLKTHFQEFGKAADPLPQKIIDVNDELKNAESAGNAADRGYRAAAGGLDAYYQGINDMAAAAAAGIGVMGPVSRDGKYIGKTEYDAYLTNKDKTPGTSPPGSTEKTWAGKDDLDYTGGDPDAWKTDARLKNEAATATRNYADAVATVAPPTREATASTRELDTGLGSLSSTSSAATAPIQAETTAVTGLGSAAPAAAAGLTYFRDAQGRLTDMVMQAPVPLNTEATAVTGAGAAASAATPKVTGLNTGIAGTASAASGATGPVSGLGSAVASTGSQATSAAGQINGATSAINGAKAAAASASSVLAATAGNLGSVASSANTAAASFVSMGKQYLTARNSIQSNPITSIHTIKTIVEGGGANVAPGASATKYYPKFHEGGTYEAPAGQSEGFAKLLDGERVLSRAETREYEGGGIAAAVAAGIAKGLSAIGLGSAGGDVIVHGDVKLSEDYSYDRFRTDVGRWKDARIAKGVL